MVPHGQGTACSLQPEALAGCALFQAEEGAVEMYGSVQLNVLLLQRAHLPCCHIMSAVLGTLYDLRPGQM